MKKVKISAPVGSMAVDVENIEREANVFAYSGGKLVGMVVHSDDLYFLYTEHWHKYAGWADRNEFIRFLMEEEGYDIMVGD